MKNSIKPLLCFHDKMILVKFILTHFKIPDWLSVMFEIWSSQRCRFFSFCEIFSYSYNSSALRLKDSTKSFHDSSF